jgi:hypothetical protein
MGVPKATYWIDMDGTNVVKLKYPVGAINAALAAALGWTLGNVSGKPPAGKTVIGQGRSAALDDGAIQVNLVYYSAANTNNQVARLLVSPTKATVGLFATFKGKTYNGNEIVDVRTPRHIKYTF